MKYFYFLIIFIVSIPLCFAQNHPFPQNLSYTTGTIKPNHKTITQINNDVTNYYAAWKTKYIKNCSGKYYVDFTDEDPSQITTSESHGYGMMIMALIAGHDANAKTIYDGMYAYYKAHTSSLNNKLMSWQQANCSTPAGNDDAATDGDLDIAYSLLLADAQWGSSGTINYLQEGKNIIQAIMTSEINSTSYHTLLGDWANSATYLKLSRTSDFILDHFKAFEAATGDSRWNNVYEKTQNLISYLQSSSANPALTGLLPDFIQNANTATPVIPTGQVLESPQDGWYNWNACRDPWRMSTGYLINGDIRSKTATGMIINWLKSKSSNPASFTCITKLDGTGNSTGELAFIAPYMVGMMVDPANQPLLNSTYDWVINAGINNFTYFHNTIKMLCLLTVSGNYWPPAISTGINEDQSDNADFTASIVSVHPNEITLSVLFRNSNSQNAYLEIYNVLGTKVLFSQRILVNGLSNITLPIGNLEQGLYIIWINTATGRKSMKFIK